MDINLNIGAKGIVNIKRIRDGVVQEEHTFHNLTLPTGYVNISYGQNAYAGVICLGSDSTPPTTSDKYAVKAQVAASNASVDSWVIDLDEPSMTYTVKASFTTGTGTAYTVAEVGTRAQNGYVCSRALVTDSEGSPITITKTEYDELEVLYTFKFTYTGQKLRATSEKATGRNQPFSGHYVPSYLPFLIRYGGNMADAPTGNWTTYTQSKITYADYATTFTCEASTSLSYGYVHALACVGSTGYYSQGVLLNEISFPNTDIFPVRTLTGYSLGTGDGTTTDFTPELPWWLENTEKVYKNGVALTRDVDYLVDNFHSLTKSYTTADNRENLVYHFDSAQLATSKQEVNLLSNSNLNSIHYYFYNNAYDNTEDLICRIAASAPNLTIDRVYFDAYYSYWYSSNVYRYTPDVSFSNDNGNTWTTIPRPAKKLACSSGTRTITQYDAQESWGGIISNYEVKLDTPITGVTHIKFSRFMDATVTNALPTSGVTPVTPTGTNTMGSMPYKLFIGHVGDYAIRFIDPPAEGDVLTMDCGIDRPWIGGKEVLNYTVNQSITNV